MSVITESEIPAPPLTCGECWCETEEASIGDIVQIDFLDHAQDSEDGPIYAPSMVVLSTKAIITSQSLRGKPT